MSVLPAAAIRTVFARVDLWGATPFFHGRERSFWVVTKSGTFFRLADSAIERVKAPFATPQGMTLEAVDWDAARKQLRGVAIDKARNQVAILVEGSEAVIVEAPARLGDWGRKFFFTAAGLVVVAWDARAWDAYRLDGEKSWISLGPSVVFPRCDLLVARERTGAGRLVVLERRSGAIAIHDGEAWAPFDGAQIGVRAMLTDPITGHVIVFDDDPANAAWRLDGDAWTEIPYRVTDAPCVRGFGVVGSNAAVAGDDEIFFCGGVLQGRPTTVGVIWNGKQNVVTSWGVRCLDVDEGLHVEGHCAVFTSDGQDAPPFIRIDDGTLFETRAEAKLPAASSDASDANDGDEDVLGAFATESRTGTRIAAHESGLVTVDAAGGHKRTKHPVAFTRVLAIPGGGVFLGGRERSGKEALRYAYFDGTTLYDLPIDPKARPRGLTDEKTYDGVVDVFVDSKSGHVLAGFEDGGVGSWSIYLGAGKWLPVVTASTSTEDVPVVWDDARRQLLTTKAVVDDVPMVGVFASPLGALLDANDPPASTRFDVKTMKKPIVLCSPPKAAKGAAAATKPPAPIVLTKGLVLKYEATDCDVRDTYAFTVREAGEQLRITYSPTSSKTALVFTMDAIESARRSVGISQHDHELGDENERAIAKALPPFLVSRKVLREMRKGKATLNCEGPGDVAVTVKSAKRHIQRGDSSVEVNVLHGKSRDLEIWVLDDEPFPLVLRRVVGGDQEWKLLDIVG